MVYTPEEFEAKLHRFAENQPVAVRAALKGGSKDLLAEVQRRYSARLKRRSGKLYRSLKVLDLRVVGDTVSASVGVGNVDNHSQVYKGVTHELGATRSFKGGQPYVPTASGPVYVSRKSPIADRLPKTAPYTVTIPARPFIHPAKEAKLEAIKRWIIDELMKEYQDA